MTKEIDLERALVDPGSVFPTPEDVVACEALTPEQRAEILCRWEYDARELDVADEEGMPDGEVSLLDRIAHALETLGYTAERDRPPPTKQGGVACGRVRRTTPPADPKK